MKKLSAVVLTFNEERNISRCIESLLPIADEVLIVDSFSTDNTEKICRSFPAVKFIKNTFSGYIEQKNYGKEQALHEIILSLDADEALSPELLKSVLSAKQNWTHDGYTMNRLTNYCGKWIRHSGWYPDVKMRLFDRTKGHWGGINPHDKFIMDKTASVKHLEGDIFHYSYYTIEEHKRQVEKFAEIAAGSLNTRGVKSGFLKIIYKPIARFLRSYLIHSGFLDGKEGFIIAQQTARASFLRYRKLYQLQNKK